MMNNNELLKARMENLEDVLARHSIEYTKKLLATAPSRIFIYDLADMMRIHVSNHPDIAYRMARYDDKGEVDFYGHSERFSDASGGLLMDEIKYMSDERSDVV